MVQNRVPVDRLRNAVEYLNKYHFALVFKSHMIFLLLLAIVLTSSFPVLCSRKFLTTSTSFSSLKVSFVGGYSVGKTAIIRRIADQDQRFNHQSDIIAPTVPRITRQIDGQNIILNLWDTAGQEKFGALRVNFVRGSAIVFVVVDLSNGVHYVL